VITSLTSPKIARVRRLLDTHSPREREELGAFVVEGLRAVRTAMEHSGTLLEEIFVIEKWLRDFPSATLISEEVANKVSETVSSQGIFATIKLPGKSAELATAGDVAIFIELQDPGNAGTVIRSAHAFGFETIALSKGSVDPYSAKVVRASVGSLTATTLVTGNTWQEMIDSLRGSHQLLAFDTDGVDIRELTPSRPVAMIFGNEARGLPEELLMDGTIAKVRIPMSADAESLNVASAATVAMYEISQRTSK
jgi:TrmH family RNA methyltransferase